LTLDVTTAATLTTQEVRDLLDGYAVDHVGETRLRAAIDRPVPDFSLYHEVGRDLGLAEVLLPEWAGGLGGDIDVAVTAFERLGACLAWGPFRPTLGVSLPLLAGVAESAASRELLERIGGGAVVVALEVATARTVPFGAEADVLLFPVVRDGTMALLQVEADDPAVTRTAVPCIDPTQRLADVDVGAAASRVVADDVAVAWARARRHAALVHAASTLGTAGTLLALAVEHARERWQFGRPIGSFQAVKHRCARMLVEHRLADAAVLRAARASGDRRELEVAVAVLAVRHAAEVIGAGALQVLGGIGFTWEHPGHLYFKRLAADRQLAMAFGDAREPIGCHLGVRS